MVASSYHDFFSKTEKRWASSGHVKCRVLPPFQTKGMTPDSVSQLAKLIQTKMQKEFTALNEEMGLIKQQQDSLIEDEALNAYDLDFEHLDTSVLDNEQNESLSQSYLSDKNNNSIIEEEPKKSK